MPLYAFFDGRAVNINMPNNIPLMATVFDNDYSNGREYQLENDATSLEDDTSSRALAGMRILVVDDEPDCAILTGHLLNEWGAEVKIVISAIDALEAFEQYDDWPPNILVSDIQMPVIDGYALIRKVREMDPDRGGNIPAIALTAYTRAEDRIRALIAGFQIHIGKPVEPIELLTVVKSVLNR